MGVGLGLDGYSASQQSLRRLGYNADSVRFILGIVSPIGPTKGNASPQRDFPPAKAKNPVLRDVPVESSEFLQVRV